MLIIASSQEILSPNEEKDVEFTKELAKLMMDTLAESPKVDQCTEQTLCPVF